MTTDYKSDMNISVHELDKEAVRQPNIYLKYSKKYAEAVHTRDTAKDRAEVIKAELESNMRKNPNLYDLEKTTDSAVAAAARIHSDVKIANKELIDANKDVNIYMGVKFAADHKKAMLDLLGRLYVAGYWAEPKILSRATEEIAEVYAKEQMEDELQDNPRMKNLQKLRRKDND